MQAKFVCKLSQTFFPESTKNLWTLFTLNIEVRIEGRGGRSCCVTHVADTFERKKHVHSCRWECIYIYYINKYIEIVWCDDNIK